MKKKLFLLFSLITILLSSCKKDKELSTDVYIGGRIANPSSKFVIISKNDIALDTFYLDGENQFGGKLKNVEEGLYIFKHPPENQVMYLQPGDSTLVFVNTLSFDESLNFSGNEAVKSNFFTNMYLVNQQNNDLVLSYYKLTPVEFARKTDSIREVRKKHLVDLDEKFQLSDEFYNLACTTINYEYYDLRERYALLIRKYLREYVDDIPEDFHEYREDINFNDEDLQDYYVYLNLIDDYLRTRSVEYCQEENIEDKDCYNLTSLGNIRRRMIMTDSLLTNPNIKYTFLDRLAAQGIIFSETPEDINGIMKVLEEINYQGEALADLKQMAMVQQSLLPGNNIGDLKLIDVNNDTIMLKDISDKPMITFPWSLTSQNQHRWQHGIIDDLKNKYPEINFIGLNIDDGETELWQKTVLRNKYDPNLEYKIRTIEGKDDLLKNYINKLVFMDTKGNIVEGDVQLNSPEVESRILEFLNL